MGLGTRARRGSVGVGYDVYRFWSVVRVMVSAGRKSESRLRVDPPGRCPPVRMWRFLPFWPRDLALGVTAGCIAVSGDVDGPGAVVATEGVWGEVSGGILVRLEGILGKCCQKFRSGAHIVCWARVLLASVIGEGGYIMCWSLVA